MNNEQLTITALRALRGGMGEWGSGGSEQQTQFSFGLFWLSLKTAIYVPHSRGNCYNNEQLTINNGQWG